MQVSARREFNKAMMMLDQVKHFTVGKSHMYATFIDVVYGRECDKYIIYTEGNREYTFSVSDRDSVTFDFDDIEDCFIVKIQYADKRSATLLIK